MFSLKGDKIVQLLLDVVKITILRNPSFMAASNNFELAIAVAIVTFLLLELTKHRYFQYFSLQIQVKDININCVKKINHTRCHSNPYDIHILCDGHPHTTYGWTHKQQ